jgi:hypothetical protein
MKEIEAQSEQLRKLRNARLDLLVLEQNGWLKEKHAQAAELFHITNFKNPDAIITEIDAYLALKKELEPYSNPAQVYLADGDAQLSNASSHLLTIENLVEEKRSYFTEQLEREVDCVERAFKEAQYDQESIIIFGELMKRLLALKEYSEKVGYRSGSKRIDADLTTIESVVHNLRDSDLTHPAEQEFNKAREKERLDKEFNKLYHEFMSENWDDTRKIRKLERIKDQITDMRDKYESLEDAPGVSGTSMVETKSTRILSRLYAKRRKTIRGRVMAALGGLFALASVIEAGYILEQFVPYVKNRLTGQHYERIVHPADLSERREPTEKNEEPHVEAQPIEKTTQQASLQPYFEPATALPPTLEVLCQRNSDFQYCVYVDKAKNQTSLYKKTPDGLKEIFSCRSSDGTVLGPKEKKGDRKTPEGIYRIRECRECGDHPLYGAFALKLDYPNTHDQSLGRTGGGILVCGTNLPKREAAIQAGLDCSDGGVILQNADIKKLYHYVAPYTYKTLVVIEDPARPLFPKDSGVIS